MGTHWSNAKEFVSFDACNTTFAIPIALLTDQDGDVHGFIIQAFGQDFKGFRNEAPNGDVRRFSPFIN